jgi:hypothetical protein
MAFAAAKYAYGLCDICGQRYRLTDLRKNWKGFMVCSADYEPKEPQLFPIRVKGDAIAVQDPRPDRIEPLIVNVGGVNDTLFTSNGMQPAPVAKALVAAAKVGTVTVSIS